MDGKQIKNASIAVTKLMPLPSVPASNTDPTSQIYVDAAIAQSVNNQDWKNSVRTASSINVTIASPGASIGGVSLNANDRVLLYGQSTASQNWIWIWNGASTPMTRATDADGASEVTAQAAVSVEEGTDANKSFRITNTGAIIVGTTAITVQGFLTFAGSTPAIVNKFMTASVTVADGDVACATGVGSSPATSSFVGVIINGDSPEIGNAVKTKDCYFSDDSGATAKAFGSVVSGDKLYWNGSIAGYQLAITDKITFLFNA